MGRTDGRRAVLCVALRGKSYCLMHVRGSEILTVREELCKLAAICEAYSSRIEEFSPL